MRSLATRLLILLLLFWPITIWAAGNESASTQPVTPGGAPTASFLTDLRNILGGTVAAGGSAVSGCQGEDACRFAEQFPGGMVFSGGTHATAGSCTSAAFATTAYTPVGNRVRNAPATINYSTVGCNCADPGSDTAWVIASALSADTSGNFQRVSGTDYFVDCVSTDQPTLPSDSIWLMQVSLVNGAINAVTDLRVLYPSSQSWDNTHQVSGGLEGEMRAWFADGFAPYIVSGCAPVVPGSGLTFAAFACNGYAEEGGATYYITQAAAAVTVPNSATVWLALHRERSGTPSGCGGGNWTRVSGTHYLTCASATAPAHPTGGQIVVQVTVSGGNITRADPVPSVSPTVRTARVYDVVRDGGALCTGQNAAANQDEVGINAAITVANANPGTIIYFPEGAVCTIDTQLTTITGNRTIVVGYGATLNVNANNTNAFLFSGSSTATTSTIAAANNRGDVTLTVASAAGMAAGDRIEIAHTAGTYHTREMNEIVSIAGAVLTLRWPLSANYDSGGTSTVTVVLPIEYPAVYGLRVRHTFTGTKTGGGNIGFNRALWPVVRDIKGDGGYDGLVFFDLSGRHATVENAVLYNSENIGIWCRGYPGSVFRGNTTVFVGQRTDHDGTITVISCADSVIEGNTLSTIVNTGIWVNQRSHGTKVASNTLIDIGRGIAGLVEAGIEVDGSDDVIVTGNVILGSDTYGIQADSSNNVVISHNKIDSSLSSNGIRVRLSNFAQVLGNFITSTATNGEGIAILNASARAVVSQNVVIGHSVGIECNLSGGTTGCPAALISNNVVRNPDVHAFQIIDSADVLISANRAEWTATAGDFCIVLSGLNGGSDSGRVFDNLCLMGNSVSSAIRIVAGSDNVVMIGNETDTTSPVSDSGTGTRAVSPIGHATTTWDPPNIVNGSSATTTVAVTNSNLGDRCIASFSLSLAGLQLGCYVSVDGTVTGSLNNNTGAGVDLGSGTLRVTVDRLRP